MQNIKNINNKTESGIVSVNVFREDEKNRVEIFTAAMARAIARSEKNIKTHNVETGLDN